MGLRPAVPSALPVSAHSSCQTATWPTWANWRRAPTLTPPRGPPEPPWPRAAMLGPPPWTSSASRASCFAPGGPVRWSGRARGHRPPPWPEASPEASASSWTAKSEARTGPWWPGVIYSCTRGARMAHGGEAGGPDLWPPNPTPYIFVCPSVLLPFHGGGTQPRWGAGGGGGEEDAAQRLFQCV